MKLFVSLFLLAVFAVVPACHAEEAAAHEVHGLQRIPGLCTQDLLPEHDLVDLLEQDGANAVQLEDQTLPKRCGHLSGKTLISSNEMVGKIRAALDSRRRRETLVIARTDAIAVEGLESALERGERYAEAGADIAGVYHPADPPQNQEIYENDLGLSTARLADLKSALLTIDWVEFKVVVSR